MLSYADFIKELEKKAKVELKSVDSLKTIDTIIVTRIRIIKQKIGPID